MANIFQMVKQAASLQRDMKRVQKDLAKTTVEHRGAGGKIVVAARGDMSVESIRLDPEWLRASSPAAVESALVSTINGALAAAKKEAGKEISRIAAGMGLPEDLLT